MLAVTDIVMICRLEYQLLSPAKNEPTDEKVKFSVKFFNLVIIKMGT